MAEKKLGLAKAHNEIIENTDLMSQIASLFGQRKNRYESDRDFFEQKCEVADGMDKNMQNKALSDQEKQSAVSGGNLSSPNEDSNTVSDVPSPFFNRVISNKAALANAAINSQELPWKYEPIRNPEIWADSTEGYAQAAVRNTLTEWSLKTDGWFWKEYDYVREAVKYGHLFILYTWEEKSHKGQFLQYDEKTATGSIKSKDDSRGYPAMRMLHPLDVFADKDIGTMERQIHV
jgi:hypothetical protein